MTDEAPTTAPTSETEWMKRHDPHGGLVVKRPGGSHVGVCSACKRRVNLTFIDKVTAALTPPTETVPTTMFEVPFQALGSVLIRARTEDEAEELANERFGAEGLVRADAFDDLVFNHKWGPGIDTSDETEETPVPPSPVVRYEVHSDNKDVTEHFRHEPCGDEDCPGPVPLSYASEADARKEIEATLGLRLATTATCYIERISVTRETVAKVETPKPKYVRGDRTEDPDPYTPG